MCNVLGMEHQKPSYHLLVCPFLPLFSALLPLFILVSMVYMIDLISALLLSFGLA